MSIRVNNHEVALTPQTGSAEQLKPSGSSGGANSVSGKTTEDQIEVSASTENINSALTAQNLQRSQNIQQLGALVAQGRYNIASGDISRAIVSSAIGATAGQE
jgi:anti-sigma28 factor (negative regulator of flagellin synthesis)